MHEPQRIRDSADAEHELRRSGILDPAREEARVDVARFPGPERALICECGLYAASATNAPALERTSTVSPDRGAPSTLSTAPEKIHGCRRLSDFSRPLLSRIAFTDRSSGEQGRWKSGVSANESFRCYSELTPDRAGLRRWTTTESSLALGAGCAFPAVLHLRALQTRTRVRSVVHLREVLKIEMRIHLRCRDARVAQHFLLRADLRSIAAHAMRTNGAARVDAHVSTSLASARGS